MTHQTNTYFIALTRFTG